MVTRTDLEHGGGVAANRDAIEDGIRAALEARQRLLDDYTTKEIVELLAAAARAWCAPHYSRRRRVIADLSELLAMHPLMLGQGLDAMFGVITEENLDAWIEAEVGKPETLGAPATDSRGRLIGPRVLFHALAGNVPGLALPQICAAALARSVCILRESRRQPLLTTAFLDTLAELSPELAALIVPAAWTPSDTLTEKFVFDWADHVEVTGSDAIIGAIAERHSRRRIIAHGTRLSIAVLPATAPTMNWAEGLARDLVLYEGQGCLTPQLLIVEGDDEAGDRAAKALAMALERLAVLWPRQPRPAALENLRRAFIADCEVAAAYDKRCRLLRGRDDAWAIRADPEARWIPGPGSRTITIVPVVDLDEALDLVHESETPLAGVAIATAPGCELFEAFAEEVRGAGASLVCPVGELQRPPIEWQPDGASRLGDIVAWRQEED